MKLRMLILTLLLGLHLYAFPSQCYDAMSGYYDLQTGEETPLKRDKLKSYFKQDGEKILVSGNQYNWFPLAMIANNEENIQLVDSIEAGFVLYTYHKKNSKNGDPKKL